VAGETYTAMEFAEHIRRKFFPEDTLEEDIDGSLFPLRIILKQIDPHTYRARR
jgi:hypothetical protein